MSCSPLKKVQNTQAQSNHNIDAVINTQHQERVEAVAVTVSDIQTEENYRRTVEIFDTSKPIDPQTGMAPLRERMIEEYGRTRLEKQDKAEETTTEASINIVEDIKLDEQTSEVVETSYRRGITTTQRMFIYIGILVVIAGLAWVAVKLLKNRLKIF